jgi:hypothetical protein
MPLAPPPNIGQDVSSKQYRDWFYSIYNLLGKPGTTLGTMAYENSNSVSITGGAIGGVGITGSNINLTPIGAANPSTGAFTDLSASGTISGRFPYGQFYSTAGQTAAAINTVYTVNIDTQDGHYLTSLASNAVTVTNAGVYNVQFSLQFTNSASSIGNVAFWPAVNGTDAPWSATSLAIVSSHGGINGYGIGTANVMVKLNAGDVVTMRWVTDNTGCSIFANSTPPPFTAPFIPGIILTLQYVSSS